MDRIRTIFLNIFNEYNYAMEMYNIKEIHRNSSAEWTVLITNEDRVIWVPMNIEDHNKFMEAVFSNKEVWFSYIGFFKTDNYTKNERMSDRIREKNSDIPFSIVTSKE